MLAVPQTSFPTFSPTNKEGFSSLTPTLKPTQGPSPSPTTPAPTTLQFTELTSRGKTCATVGLQAISTASKCKEAATALNKARGFFNNVSVSIVSSPSQPAGCSPIQSNKSNKFNGYSHLRFNTARSWFGGHLLLTFRVDSNRGVDRIQNMMFCMRSTPAPSDTPTFPQTDRAKYNSFTPTVNPTIPAPTRLPFAALSSRTCARAGLLAITTTKECKQAVTALSKAKGKTGMSVSTQNNADIPSGCYARYHNLSEGYTDLTFNIATTLHGPSGSGAIFCKQGLLSLFMLFFQKGLAHNALVEVNL